MYIVRYSPRASCALAPAMIDRVAASTPLVRNPFHTKNNRSTSKTVLKGGVLSNAHVNIMTLNAIDTQLGDQIRGENVLGILTPHDTIVKTLCLSQSRGATSTSTTKSKKPLKQRPPGYTNPRTAYSPEKRDLYCNQGHIANQLRVYNCHRSIYTQRSGDIVDHGNNFYPDCEAHDGTSSCRHCLDGNHRVGVSRQCNNHCYTHMSAQKVFQVRTYVSERFGDKVEGMIELFLVWADIQPNELVTLQSTTSIDDKSRKQILERLTLPNMRLCVPTDPTTCNGLDGWNLHNPSCVQVCKHGFRMFTGVSEYRMEKALTLLRRGLTKVPDRVGKRTMERMSRSHHYGTEPHKPLRTQFVTEMLQELIRSSCQFYANGDIRLQHTLYPTKAALVEAVINAFWERHPRLLKRRKLKIKQICEELMISQFMDPPPCASTGREMKTSADPSSSSSPRPSGHHFSPTSTSDSGPSPPRSTPPPCNHHTIPTRELYTCSIYTRFSPTEYGYPALPASV